MSDATLSSRESPIEILQGLLRFDTSNPPGNEGPCIDFVDGLLQSAGVATERVTKEPGRPNLIARLPGNGRAPALLFYGHIDVVPADTAAWRHPPFAGTIAEGCAWGRGALDMKGGVAMMVSAFLRAASAGVVPAGDLLLASSRTRVQRPAARASRRDGQALPASTTRSASSAGFRFASAAARSR
jgi:acetylornithine deacetylase/succinyl-diaminopimelate desuccinylase-like protein